MEACELIKRLQELSSDDPNIQIRLNTDHSQQLMRITYIDYSYLSPDESTHSYFPNYSDDNEEYDNKGIKVIEIQAY